MMGARRRAESGGLATCSFSLRFGDVDRFASCWQLAATLSLREYPFVSGKDGIGERGWKHPGDIVWKETPFTGGRDLLTVDAKR